MVTTNATALTRETFGEPVPAHRVAELLALVHRVHLESADPFRCATALAERLAAVFSAHMVALGELAKPTTGRAASWSTIHIMGDRDDLPREIQRLVEDSSCPMIRALQAGERPTTTVRTTDVGLVQPIAHDLLISGAPLAHRPDWIGTIILSGSTGRPFPEQDRLLLDTLHRELAPWLWSRIGVGRAHGLDAAPRHASRERMVERLSPAQRVVLPFLLEGKTEAEIAKRIFRSRYTVHDHARAIYATFGVRSRVELVRLFMTGDHDGAAMAPPIAHPVGHPGARAAV